MKKWKLALIIIVTALAAALPVAAQTDAPPEPGGGVAPAATITVSGRIVNGTDGAQTPANLEIMIHVWDANFNEMDMIHGETDGDGAFQFTDVPNEPGWLYAVMASYEGSAYLSEPLSVAEGEEALYLETSVFETTDALSTVLVESMHLFFETEQGGLFVTEIYSLSNLGDKTIVGAEALDDGTPATIRFILPPDAASVDFRGNQSRYFLTSDGFADTTPLVPGVNSGQVVISYVLPYDSALTLERTTPFPTKEVNILLPPSLGLTLDEDNWIAQGRQDLGQGLTVDVFSLEDLEADAAFSVALSGDLALPGADPTAPGARTSATDGLAVGGVMLGLVVIGVGIWWIRRMPDEEEEELSEAFEGIPFEGDSLEATPINGSSFEGIVEKIAMLDAAHDEQEIDDRTYQLQRAALRDQARAALARDAG